MRNEADRGVQSIALHHLDPISGPLIFTFHPGQADNISCDWGYWESIRIY